MTDIRGSFQFFDKNGDGSISRDELAAVMSYLGHEPGQADLEAMMRQVDGDGKSAASTSLVLTHTRTRTRTHKHGNIPFILPSVM
ncbi:unnamed protein product [Protopolystoma xenopodis]|uniref:EF-hand domain-containing protein n=1 Tax=Protopolystoma xenopodis TaxID=117903 RepID=A0A448WHW9_9PLAT|nr:unnamed protein product [Protopolystoma xenopodis]